MTMSGIVNVYRSAAPWRWLALLLAAGCSLVLSPAANADDLFRDQVAPIFARRCLSCHSDTEKKGEFSLQSAQALQRGGEVGFDIEPGDPESSYLVELITPVDGKAEMPKNADPLSAEEIAAIRRWVAAGAEWPDGFRVEPARVTDLDWWSLRPLVRPPVPETGQAQQDDQPAATPIDSFINAKLREHGLTMSPTADRRTLVRRLYYDLLGLPPSPEEVERFVNDPDPLAYEKLVDDLLESPHYGEHWARHWLDVVHYGDTHGYDKDKPRPNAWPYRDYVIRALNEDKPYGRFVQEQLAGDFLWPESVDGLVATGFISAGPWDLIGHAEVPETKIDGQVARNLDRDNMVTSTMNTFASLTIQCARCHNHKFDPVSMEDYYSLQAVFAAIDRANRKYDTNPAVARRRHELQEQQTGFESQLAAVEKQLQEKKSPEVVALEKQVAELQKRLAAGGKNSDAP
ncbi:MAG: DUF1549 domain-containing protein, partial [Planctomycetales bacterium]|nr:DUF1549 domain-containing protein [Planctomycetales bacterium]